jgi:hypothetical protein
MKIKKSLLALAASLTLIGAGCSSTLEKTIPENTSTNIETTTNTTVSTEPMKYKDFKLGITLYYPADWKTQGQENGTMIFYPKVQKSATEKTGTNVILSTQELTKSPTITLDQYTEIIKADTLKKLPDANMLGTEKITLGGLDGMVINYTASYPNTTDIKMKVFNAYVLKDKKVYIITYNSLDKNFDLFLEGAKQIVELFQFDN